MNRSDDAARAVISTPAGDAGARRCAVLGVLALSLAGWGLLAWIAIDMTGPLAQLAMPAGSDWSTLNVAAVGGMWAVMMAAMMLPSALPMIVAFVDLSGRQGEPSRGRTFVAAYVMIWGAFSVAATAAQWALQAQGWVDPMIVSTSAWLSAGLLVVAGLYQFSSLKRLCLARCRSPLGFLLGEWRGGTAGGFVMGLRHGMFCVGCCGPLMALLFVGGAMNLAWIAALAVAVAIEKLLPGGEWLATALGLALMAAGAWKLVGLLQPIG